MRPIFAKHAAALEEELMMGGSWLPSTHTFTDVELCSPYTATLVGERLRYELRNSLVTLLAQGYGRTAFRSFLTEGLQRVRATELVFMCTDLLVYVALGRWPDGITTLGVLAERLPQGVVEEVARRLVPRTAPDHPLRRIWPDTNIPRFRTYEETAFASWMDGALPLKHYQRCMAVAMAVQESLPPPLLTFNVRGGVIAMMPGLGKTFTAIMGAMLARRVMPPDEARDPGLVQGHTLVVAPKTLHANWHDEIARMLPTARVVNAHDDLEELCGPGYEERVPGFDFVLINAEKLIRDPRSEKAGYKSSCALQLRLKVQWERMIVDESHMGLARHTNQTYKVRTHPHHPPW